MASIGPREMAGKIFVNYRRGDDEALAGRLFDRLGEAFGREQLFMDVDSIAPGLDFVRVLEEHLGQCDIVLTVSARGGLTHVRGWITRRTLNASRSRRPLTRRSV